MGLKVKSVEDNQLFKEIKDCYPSGTKLWIGGQDLAKSNQWAWSTGDLIGGYFNFDPSINSESGDCLDIILPNDLTWKKSNCNGADSNHGFIAEKVEVPPLTTTTSTSTTTTPAPTTRTSTTTVSSTKPTPRPTMYPTTQGGGGPPT